MTKVKEVFPATDEQPENNTNQVTPTPDNNEWDNSNPSVFEAGGLDLDDINKRWKKAIMKHRALPEGKQTATRMAKIMMKKFTKKEVVAIFINETNEADSSPVDALMEALLGAVTGKAKVEVHHVGIAKRKTDS